MHYLYGIKNSTQRLVATFDSEQLLRSYVRWSTLARTAGDVYKFEQGSALVGSSGFAESIQPLTNDDAAAVVHNPSPSML
ncbi:MAG TPA: hypothetical protein VHV77_01685 [Pirellulales bacterium]|jgi:hypothetical protein|nr:hypothetical protein [Pirellulales bacterium]